MKNLEQKIIERANLLCKSAFMDFPDYDEENPITTLADALTVLIFDNFQDDEVESSEIYDFFDEKLNVNNKPKLKEYEIFKNGTQQGSVFAENKKEAKKQVFDTYGEKRQVYKR